MKEEVISCVDETVLPSGLFNENVYRQISRLKLLAINSSVNGDQGSKFPGVK